ncbi:ribonuclease III [bacterium]|nr:ribonuclease III [candidate division CSSED10-310 bacterium]
MFRRVVERLRRRNSRHPEAGHALAGISRERIAELRHIQQSLQVHFRNIGILDQALTHISFANEHRGDGYKNNEIMEFFGDALLDFLSAELLVEQFPNLREGPLSKARSFLVSTANLARKAQNWGIGEYLRLGRGEEMSGGRTKTSLLANTFEAVVCAVYFDRGMMATRWFIRAQFEGDLTLDLIQSPLDDYKTKLQEITQGYWGVIPKYQVVGASGPEHRKKFFVTMRIDGHVIGRGKGYTKKKAEQAAARMALCRFAKVRRNLPMDVAKRVALEHLVNEARSAPRPTEV